MMPSSCHPPAPGAILTASGSILAIGLLRATAAVVWTVQTAGEAFTGHWFGVAYAWRGYELVSGHVTKCLKVLSNARPTARFSGLGTAAATARETLAQRGPMLAFRVPSVSSQLLRIALLAAVGLLLSPAAQAITWTVNSLLEEDWNASSSTSDCNLRQAISPAGPGDTINFDFSGLTPIRPLIGPTPALP